ncbi:hypothetical protein STTU_2260 [Streptomyces sp. Tu6071]|nr:hypothetical protein STTU_2260 [Streptomyces sp. Tu6071]
MRSGPRREREPCDRMGAHPSARQTRVPPLTLRAYVPSPGRGNATRAADAPRGPGQHPPE